MSSLAEWVRNSPQDDFWLVTVIVITIAVVSFFGAFYFFSRKRVIENTPTSKIRSAAQGYVELNGYGDLMEGPPIVAPLTGNICTWYSYSIEEHKRSGKNSRWVTIDNGTSDELFIIVDDTGQCVIDPEGASVTPSESDTWYGNSARPGSIPKSRSGFLSMNSGKYRYKEKRMLPKEALYSIGLYNTVGGAGGEFDVDADVRDLLKEWKQDSEALLRKYDKNNDGEINIQEWQLVREQALRETMIKHSERKTAPPVNLLTKSNDRRYPFILSAIPQDTLVKRYNYFAIGLITIFFSAGTFASWILNIRMVISG